MYNNIDFDKLFDNESKYGKEYIQTSITEDRIKRAEQQVNHKLPNSYIEFIKLQNGGYIRNKECWLTAIYGIAEDEKSTNGLEEMYDTYIYEWEYPESVIPVGETQSGGHAMYCIDYTSVGANGEPRIVKIDNEGGNATYFVANNFQEFIDMVYYNKDIDGKLIVDEKKMQQERVAKELSDLDGNISVCKGTLFIDIIVLVICLFKQNFLVSAICIFIILIIIPFWIKYEKKYKNVKNQNKNSIN